MQRRKALVVAGTATFVLAGGLVAAAAVTGANVFGFHVPSPLRPTAADGATTSTKPRHSSTTPAPVYVMTTEVVDQLVVVPTQATEAVAQPVGFAPQQAAAYAPDDDGGDDAVPAAPVTQAPATQAPATQATAAPPSATTPPTAPATAPTTAATTAPTAAATTTTVRATTTTVRAATGTTVFDPAGALPAGFSVPSNLRVAASQTPLPPGGPFKKCQYEDNHTWNCEK